MILSCWIALRVMMRSWPSFDQSLSWSNLLICCNILSVILMTVITFTIIIWVTCSYLQMTTLLSMSRLTFWETNFRKEEDGHAPDGKDFTWRRICLKCRATTSLLILSAYKVEMIPVVILQTALTKHRKPNVEVTPEILLMRALVGTSLMTTLILHKLPLLSLTMLTISSMLCYLSAF